MKDWTITESDPMYRAYDPVTLNGIGDPVGHHVNLRVFRGIRIDVWGHGEGEEETERVANKIVEAADFEEKNRLLTESLKEAKDALQWHLDKSQPQNEADQSDFFNMTANAIAQAEQLLEVENPLR